MNETAGNRQWVFTRRPDRQLADGELHDFDGWIKAGKRRYDLDIRSRFVRVPKTFDCQFSCEHVGRLPVNTGELA